MNKLAALKANLKRGHVYTRPDLAKWSKAVDRHVQQLLLEGTLKKLSPGVYYYPKQTAFGDAPADENTLVRTFLKDDRFLITSPNVYNSLGIGTTQLYNKRIVYNHKRHGEFKLGNRSFYFRVKSHFPKKATTEFLFVDLVNNLDTLAEEPQLILEKVKVKLKDFDRDKVKRNLIEYGSVKTIRLLAPLLENTNEYA
ncbi:MAG: hypothetical protein RLZ10_885 [Bacteroidota bacterium]|jgi:hypothetical protein